MARKRDYRMISNRDNMERTPGCTPLDHPSSAGESDFEPDELTGELRIQEEEDDSTPVVETPKKKSKSTSAGS